MISILICGINTKYRNSVIENITQTIGLDHEILYFDNQIENKSISSVYNLLKAQAKGKYICFLHEDILFLESNWGLELKNIFENNENIALVGVAGATYKSKIPSTWSCINNKFLVKNYIQHYKKINKNKDIFFSNFTSDASEVVFVDGLFMCITDVLNKKILFDEELIKGFHGYDFDLCLQAKSNNFKIVVSKNIQLEHFSEGGINFDWYKTYRALCKKWAFLLPLKCQKISFLENISLDYSCFYSGLSAIGRLNMSSCLQKFLFFVSFFNFHFVWYFIFKRLKN